MKVDVTIHTKHYATIDIGEIPPTAFKAILHELSVRGIDGWGEYDLANFDYETIEVEVEEKKSK